MIKINGTAVDAVGRTLSEFLEAAGYDTARVAVEKNGVIVPRADYAGTALADGDELEVVRFVGGG